MKYHDTGSRDSSQLLATWLQELLNDEVNELRIQSGYFSIHAIGVLLPSLKKAATSNLLTTILIGSNEASTIRGHVEELFDLMGIPRSNAHLGVVSFNRGLFHPKTYHIRRSDGSQAAFVGSANLTKEGLALHIEAAISLDTKDGDSKEELDKIAAAIDSWFKESREGFNLVNDKKDLEQLVTNGVLSLIAPKRPVTTKKESVDSHGKSSRLTPLIKLPGVMFSSKENNIPDEIEDIDDESGVGKSISAPAPAPAPAAVTIGSVTNVNAQITASSLTFGMTLQNTDVGVGQTSATQATQRRSPEIFIPMSAIDLQPTFWGWYNNFTPDHEWAESKGEWLDTQAGMPFNPLRPRMKMDWRNVSIKLVGHPSLITASIWHDPIKVDIRIRAEQIRSAGSVGDIMLVRLGAAGLGYDFEIEIVKTTNPLYASFLAKLTTPIRNSQKRIGYF